MDYFTDWSITLGVLLDIAASHDSLSTHPSTEGVAPYIADGPFCFSFWIDAKGLKNAQVE